MKHYEVDYETTLPPWRFGHEEIEAEDLDAAKEKFCMQHEAAKLLQVYEILYSSMGKKTVYSDSRYG